MVKLNLLRRWGFLVLFVSVVSVLPIFAQSPDELPPEDAPIVKKVVKPKPIKPKTTPPKSTPKKVAGSDEMIPMQLHMIDDFEDGTIETNPEWWTFGNVNALVIDNYPTPDFPLLGERSLRLQGKTTDWYLGGLGTYLGLDASIYNGIKLVVWGSGEDSGTLSIELYDDDNGNWEIESYPKTDILKFDDKFVCTLKIDWIGWKTVVIPFKDFWDANPNIGDGIWNPDQKKGSGGLIQMQIVLLSALKKGDVDIRVDSVSLINATNIKPYNSENILFYPPAEVQKLESN